MNNSHAAMNTATIPYAGKNLDRDTIIALAQEFNPSLKAGSVMPSDVDDFARDAEGHGLASWKRDNPILLHRVSSGMYTILPVSERKFFASSGRGSSQGKSREELLAAARALLKENGE